MLDDIVPYENNEQIEFDFSRAESLEKRLSQDAIDLYKQKRERFANGIGFATISAFFSVITFVCSFSYADIPFHHYLLLPATNLTMVGTGYSINCFYKKVSKQYKQTIEKLEQVKNYIDNYPVIFTESKQ